MSPIHSPSPLRREIDIWLGGVCLFGGCILVFGISCFDFGKFPRGVLHVCG
jgi:hypothetical protein